MRVEDVMAIELIPSVDLVEANRNLAEASPREILQWAVETYGSKLTMATAFGPEGCTIIHMLAEIDRNVRVFNLDTGYQFAETLELRERIANRYGIEVEYVRASRSVAEYETSNGGPIYGTDPDRCCRDRKILPLHAAVEGYDAWISAIRADQSTHRARADVVGWDAKFGLVKVNPLLKWTKRDVWAFIVTNDVPYNPLHDQGFPSIGCSPCTRSVNHGDDERAGRWAGQAKTECGLHSLDSSQL
jgi:phosphoadenosine phosphosulfate reductase